MFPILVTVNNREQLSAVHAALEALTGNAPAAAAAEPAKPAKAVKEKPAKETAAPAATTTAAAPAGPSAAASKFLNERIAGPLQDLCMKDYPVAEGIIKSYGVERASLVPEAKLEEFLSKIQTALDPGAAERARLEALDKAKAPSLF